MKLKEFLKTNDKPFYLDGYSVRPDWKRYLFNGTELDMTYLKLWENLEVENIADQGSYFTITLEGWDSWSYEDKKKAVKESYDKFASWADDALERTSVKHNIGVDQVKEIIGK